MPAPDPRNAFYLALEASPGDKVTLHALADWYEEADQPEAAAALRWTIRAGCFPFLFSRHGGLHVVGKDWRDQRYWWVIDDPRLGQDWGLPPSCRLPRRIWDRLAHSFSYAPSVFKDYPTLRDAYEALITIWPLVGHLAGPVRESRP